jgi:hypothetical protein
VGHNKNGNEDLVTQREGIAYVVHMHAVVS